MDRQRRDQPAVAVRTRLTENRGGCQARPPVTGCRLLRRLGGAVCAPESAAIRSRWDTSYRSGQTPAWSARYPYVGQARGVAAECTDGRARVLAVGVRWLPPDHPADAAEPPTWSGSTGLDNSPRPTGRLILQAPHNLRLIPAHHQQPPKSRTPDGYKPNSSPSTTSTRPNAASHKPPLTTMCERQGSRLLEQEDRRDDARGQFLVVCGDVCANGGDVVLLPVEHGAHASSPVI